MTNFFKEENIREIRENNLKLIFGLGSIVYASFGIFLHTSELEYNDPIWIRLIIASIGIISLGLSLFSKFFKRNIITVLFANLYAYNAHLYYLLFTNDFNPNYKLSLIVIIIASIIFIQDKGLNKAYLIVNGLTYITILFITGNLTIESLSLAFLIMMVLVIGYLTNSERIDAFGKIKDREALLKSINNNVYHGIFRFDPDDHIVYANDNFARMLGYHSPEELAEIKNPFLLRLEEKSHLIEKIKSEKGFLKNEEVELQRLDGSTMWVLLSLTPFFNEKKELIHYDGSIIDITERKIAEKELALLSAAVDHSTTSVAITDQNGYIKYVNPFFSHVTGYTFDEVTGQKIQEYTVKDDPSNEEMWKELAEGKVWKGEVSHYNKSGRMVTELTSIAPIKNRRGEVVNFVIVSEDITERKKAERELITAKEQAEAANKAQEQFLSTISHELRTPMNAVIGITNLLLEENPKKEQIDNLNILKFSANSLLALINDILDLSKIEAGKFDFVEEEFEPAKLINRIKDAHRVKTDQKGIGLFLEIDENVPPVLKGDAHRLNQILNNLVSNAVKFTDTGGVYIGIRLSTEKGSSCRLKFCIRDTGIGIPESKIDEIFEAFSQASNLTNRIYGGTGLGLAITKRLIELQGGSIHVKSIVNEGSEFTVEMEFKKSRKLFLNSAVTAKNYTGLKGIKILLVEDNKVNQKIACKFLSKWDAIIDTADNGEDAIEMVKKKEYDIILMDIRMPGMNGYQTTDAVRKIEDGKRRVPIIALSASAMRHEREKAFNSGIDDYVTKPFIPTELYNKIAKYTYPQLHFNN